MSNLLQRYYIQQTLPKEIPKKRIDSKLDDKELKMSQNKYSETYKEITETTDQNQH